MYPQWSKYRSTLKGLNIALIVFESSSLAFNTLIFLVSIVLTIAVADLDKSDFDSLTITNLVLLVIALLLNALLLGLFIYNQKRLNDEPAQLLAKPVSSLAYYLGFLTLLQALASLALGVQAGLPAHLLTLIFRLAFSILSTIALLSRQKLIQSLKAAAL